MSRRGLLVLVVTVVAMGAWVAVLGGQFHERVQFDPAVGGTTTIRLSCSTLFPKPHEGVVTTAAGVTARGCTEERRARRLRLLGVEVATAFVGGAVAWKTSAGSRHERTPARRGGI